MKRNTFIIILLILLSFINTVSADFQGTVTVTGIIEGEVNTSMPCQVVTLEMSDEAYEFSVAQDEDITSWFSNIPPGLQATILTVSAGIIQASICGTPTQTINTQIAVSVPDGGIIEKDSGASIGQISNTPSDQAMYIITEAQPRAQYSEPSTVAGTVNVELVPQYVYIRLLNTQADFDMYDFPILSEYNGLTATVIDYDDLNSIITVEYTGTPRFEDHTLIHSTIFRNLITCDEDLIVPDRDDVLFDINPEEIPAEPVIPPQPQPKPAHQLPKTGI